MIACVAHRSAVVMSDLLAALSCWPSVDAERDDAGCTPLMLACANGHIGAVEMLISRGASVLARDAKQETALHKATCFGAVLCDDVIRILLAAGADVNATDMYGDSAVSLAAFWGHVDHMACMLTLIDKGVPVHLDACHNQGKTAEAWAYERSHIAVSNMLLQAKVL